MQLLKLFPFIFSFLAVGHLAATSSSSSSPKVQSKLRAIGDNSVLHSLTPGWAPIYLGLGDAYRERAENLTGHASEDEAQRAEREAAKCKIQRQAVICYLHALSLDNVNTLWQAKHRLLDCCLNGEGVRTNLPKALELAAELSKQNEDLYLRWFGTMRAGQMLMLGQGCSLTAANFEKGSKILRHLENDLMKKAMNGFTCRRMWTAKIFEEMAFMAVNGINTREQSSEVELLARAFLANISCLLDDKHFYAMGGFGVYNQPKSDDLKALEKCKELHLEVRKLVAEQDVEEPDDEASDEYLTKFGQLCKQGIELLRMKMSPTTSWLCQAALFHALNKGYTPAIAAIPNDPQQSPEKILLIDCYRPDGWRRSLRNALAAQALVPLASYPGLSSCQREYFNAEPVPSVELPEAYRNIADTTNVIAQAHVPPFIRRRLAIEWLEQFLRDRTFLHFGDKVPRSVQCLNGIIHTIQHDDLSEISGMMGQYGKVHAKIVLSAALFDEHMATLCANHRQLAVNILNSLLASQTFSAIEFREGEYQTFSAYDEDSSLEDVCEIIENSVPALEGNEALQTAETLTELIIILRDYYQSSIDNQVPNEG